MVSINNVKQELGEWSPQKRQLFEKTEPWFGLLRFIKEHHTPAIPTYSQRSYQVTIITKQTLANRAATSSSPNV
jgi:hypothetical protein